MAIGTYKLYGIVHHFGTYNRGHYISEVLDYSNGQAGDWYKCDDERITKL